MLVRTARQTKRLYPLFAVGWAFPRTIAAQRPPGFWTRAASTQAVFSSGAGALSRGRRRREASTWSMSACAPSSVSMLAQRSLALRPPTLALPPIRGTLTGGFSHFVPFGWRGCRAGLAPTEKRRLFTAHALSGLQGRRHRARGLGQRKEGGLVALQRASRLQERTSRLQSLPGHSRRFAARMK